MPQRLSFKEREWQRREQEILAEAARLIREQGFVNLKMDELAEVVGISKPTLYQHFKSKDDLIAHVMVRGLQELYSHADSLAQLSPLEQLQGILRMMLIKRYQPDSMLQGVNQEVFVAINNQHPQFIEQREAVNQRVQTLVVQAQAQGQIDPVLSPELVAGLLFMLMGLPQYSGPPPADSPQLTAVMDQVIVLFTRALRPS
ncbi:MAG: TetR/AcrR family transcriptional regulator [Anaerolineae bacterium]|nr:TetR/AcrR family transcriptional regulator [Anaerolineae bacterium]MDW8170856.1 TetR/AcrR family transcriptional regulator [Anaerolineae bacterium]